MPYMNEQTFVSRFSFAGQAKNTSVSRSSNIWIRFSPPYSSCSVVRHDKVRNTNIHSDWAEHDCHRIFSRLPSKALTRTTQRMTSKLLNHQKSQIVQISPSVRKTRFPWPLNRRACSQNNSVVRFLLPCKILSSIFQREFNIMEQLFHKGRMFSRGFELK